MILEEREKKIFETLREISKTDSILVGGYAINAYTPPRFSVDCDLVLKRKREAEEILLKNGFKKTEQGKIQTPYNGEFLRYEKEDIAVDLLVNGVLDRKTGIFFNYSFISENSSERETVGRAAPIRLKMRIANPETLFIMKFVSCRRQDIRDIFMLSGSGLNIDFIVSSLKTNYSKALVNIQEIKKTVLGKPFRDSLQGVYGFVQEKAFDDARKNILKILSQLES